MKKLFKSPLILFFSLGYVVSNTQAQEYSGVYKCIDVKGHVTYGNDPNQACFRRQKLDAQKLGNGMVIPSKKDFAGLNNQTRLAKDETSPPLVASKPSTMPQMPLERIAGALGFDLLGKPAVDPTAKAIEEAIK